MNSIFKGVDTTSLNGITQLITNITMLAFTAVGIVSVIFVIIGGLQLITAAGNPAGLKKARTTIIYAVGGLALAVGAGALGNFIVSNLSK